MLFHAWLALADYPAAVSLELRSREWLVGEAGAVDIAVTAPAENGVHIEPLDILRRACADLSLLDAQGRSPDQLPKGPSFPRAEENLAWLPPGQSVQWTQLSPAPETPGPHRVAATIRLTHTPPTVAPLITYRYSIPISAVPLLPQQILETTPLTLPPGVPDDGRPDLIKVRTTSGDVVLFLREQYPGLPAQFCRLGQVSPAARISSRFLLEPGRAVAPDTPLMLAVDATEPEQPVRQWQFDYRAHVTLADPGRLAAPVFPPGVNVQLASRDLLVGECPALDIVIRAPGANSVRVVRPDSPALDGVWQAVLAGPLRVARGRGPTTYLAPQTRQATGVNQVPDPSKLADLDRGQSLHGRLWPQVVARDAGEYTLSLTLRPTADGLLSYALSFSGLTARPVAPADILQTIIPAAPPPAPGSTRPGIELLVIQTADNEYHLFHRRTLADNPAGAVLHRLAPVARSATIRADLAGTDGPESAWKLQITIDDAGRQTAVEAGYLSGEGDIVRPNPPNPATRPAGGP